MLSNLKVYKESDILFASLGTIMVSYQPLGEFPNFFRSIISNQAIQESDVDFMLSEIDRLGHDL